MLNYFILGRKDSNYFYNVLWKSLKNYLFTKFANLFKALLQFYKLVNNIIFVW